MSPPVVEPDSVASFRPGAWRRRGKAS